MSMPYLRFYITLPVCSILDLFNFDSPLFPLLQHLPELQNLSISLISWFLYYTSVPNFFISPNDFSFIATVALHSRYIDFPSFLHSYTYFYKSPATHPIPLPLCSFLSIGGELYTGLTADFLGRDSVILRSMGGRSPMRTETDERLLHGNKF